MKKIVFLTGTRADYGKLKSLIKKIDDCDNYKCSIFVTGMHMLSKYGSTFDEIEKDGYKDIYKYINQTTSETMDIIMSNTILGFSNYIKEFKPDLIVVHGDRLEALAGAVVGAFNNVLVAHIEGGEVSGTIDESIRHSITKLAHIHFVANEDAKKRIIQLGEKEESIFIIGSPDIDVMMNTELPNINEVKRRYNIEFLEYSIFMYHPVTTEIETLATNIKESIDALLEANENFIVIYPNNDLGTEIVLNEIKRLENNKKFRIFPSIRFEYFLSLLKNADSIIGNSSVGIREAGVYGVPAVNVGNRQNNRCTAEGIINVKDNKEEIIKAIKSAKNLKVNPSSIFGEGNSTKRFFSAIESNDIWNINRQKVFIDLENKHFQFTKHL